MMDDKTREHDFQTKTILVVVNNEVWGGCTITLVLRNTPKGKKNLREVILWKG